MQIVMCDKRDYGRGFGKGTPSGQIDHLLRDISREALINGMRGSNGLAIAKNGCCRIRPPFGINVDLGKVFAER